MIVVHPTAGPAPVVMIVVHPTANFAGRDDRRANKRAL